MQPYPISTNRSYLDLPSVDAVLYQRIPLNFSNAIWSVQNKTKASLPLVITAALTPVALI